MLLVVFEEGTPKVFTGGRRHSLVLREVALGALTDRHAVLARPHASDLVNPVTVDTLLLETVILAERPQVLGSRPIQRRLVDLFERTH